MILININHQGRVLVLDSHNSSPREPPLQLPSEEQFHCQLDVDFRESLRKAFQHQWASRNY